MMPQPVKEPESFRQRRRIFDPVCCHAELLLVSVLGTPLEDERGVTAPSAGTVREDFLRLGRQGEAGIPPVFPVSEHPDPPVEVHVIPSKA
jgi:hypothetical protein